MKRISASAVQYQFWFAEFVQSIGMVVDSGDLSLVRQKILAENIFQASSSARLKSETNVVLRRVDSLTPAMRGLFDQLDPVNQRIMNLIAIMNTEQLMYAFMYDVFRPELILGDRQIEAYEMAAFFKKLPLTHKEAAHWTEETLRRLQSTVAQYLRRAQIVKDYKDTLVVENYLLDERLADRLREENHLDYLAILTGRTS
jgi:hypothetical protein